MIAVIGCGNLNRQDDGVGPEVVRALSARGLAGGEVKLLDAGTDGMAVMFAARGCTTLIVVDASRTGAEPGAIYEVPGAELARPYAPSLNLHDFSWEAALHAGRQIFRDAFPADVVVLLVEAQALGFGVGLSAPVATAAETVGRRIEALVAARFAETAAFSPPPCGEGPGVGVVQERTGTAEKAVDVEPKRRIRRDPPPQPSPARGEGARRGLASNSLRWP